MGGVAFAAYLLTALWAHEISLPGPVLIWFPPAGVAIAATYFAPRTAVVVVAAELISTPWIMGFGEAYGIVPLLVNSVGLAAAFSLGGWVLRRLALDPRLRTPEDVAVLVAGIAAAATASTVVGIAVQRWIGLVDTDGLAGDAAVFWVGDVVGAFCLLPAAVLVGSALLAGRRPPVSDRPGEVPGWLLAAEIVSPAVAAIALMEIGQQPLRFVYLAFLPVLVVALRHGVAAAALATTVLASVLTAGAHLQIDAVLERSDFQLLMLVLTLTGVMTGSVISARRDALDATRRVSAIVEATPDLVASAWRDGTVQYLNPVGRDLLGFHPERDPGGRAFDFLPDQLAEDLMRQGMRIAEQQGTWTGENRLIRPDGHVIPVSQVLITHPLGTTDGQVLYSTICRDITDQRALEDQLRQAALYDRATGLANRALLEEQLQRALATGGRPRRLAVLFADVDRLQHVNETFGFQAGDAVVAAIADRLTDLVRGQDLVARHGGSQFVVVLTDVPDELEAIAVANRLLGSFARPVPHDGRALKVTGSVGITVAEPGEDHLHVLRGAEIALHRAREAGGGRFALFDDAMQARAQRRLETEADLREVLETGSWTLAYQPIFDSVDRRVVSVEALLRWSHPTRGAVPPGELIALAESSGAIVDLGREIFRRACDEACRWHAMGYHLPIHINVSARQLREPSFVDDVRAVMAETGIDPRSVTVELTETTIATREFGEADTLQALRDLGCEVALDDFGTGWSSLAELRDLPIDQVKLDQSFTTELTTSPRAAAMVSAVVALATALDLEVVAEGVERDAQIDALAALGCRRIQGFALSRAVSPEVITGMLRDARPVGPGDGEGGGTLAR